MSKSECWLAVVYRQKQQITDNDEVCSLSQDLSAMLEADHQLCLLVNTALLLIRAQTLLIELVVFFYVH